MTIKLVLKNYVCCLQKGSINFSRFLKSVEDDDVDNIITVKLYQNDLVAVDMPENIMTTNIELHSQVLKGSIYDSLMHINDVMQVAPKIDEQDLVHMTRQKKTSIHCCRYL